MATAPKTIVKSSKGGGGGGGADEGGGGGGGKSKKKLIIIIVAAVVALSAAGAGAFLFMGKKKTGDKAEATKEEKPKADHSKPPKFVNLDPFTVNLAGEGGDQYLQATLTIQVTDPKMEEMIKNFMPQIRSRLLILLSGKKAADISTVEGKAKLTEEILEQLREPFQHGSAPQEIDNVFITSFIIQ